MLEFPTLFVLSPESPPQPRQELFATLARIDGWGKGAWREITSTWQLSSAILVVDDLEAEVSRAADDDVVAMTLVLPVTSLGRDPRHDDATCDWVLRRVWHQLMPGFAVTATTYRPGATVERTNACVLANASAGAPRSLLLRLLVRLPLAGMCCDGARLGRALRQIERFARELASGTPGSLAGLTRHRRAVQVQRALRAALPAHGLVAFIGEGALLARDREDHPTSGCMPLQVERGSCTTIDLGALGQYHGLGLRTGVTAIAGAPYHGKSTLLQAVIAGAHDHVPGDGRELTVSDASVLAIQADDGRRIKRLDLTTFFRALPGGQAGDFTSARASGATSMAASLLQGIAAGCRLVAIDEDTAASNFLTIDPTMRRLLGAALHGTTTLLEVLPHLARHGISTVLVAGAHTASLGASEQVVMMRDYQPHEVTRRVRRLLQRLHLEPPRHSRAVAMPVRVLADEPDCLFGPRHFLVVDATQPDRPVIAGQAVDLRRSGWNLDAAQVRGALAAAAWVCRLAEGRPLTLAQLRTRYEDFIARHGVRGLDPFATVLLCVPPWQLVVSVLERLPRPLCVSAPPARPRR